MILCSELSAAGRWREAVEALEQVLPQVRDVLISGGDGLTLAPGQTLVVNVTNQCNLSCTYCYEYGEDKIVQTENGKQPKMMTEAK